MTEIILGLDISTSTIGISILRNGTSGPPHLAHVDYFKPPKKGTLFERLTVVKNKIIHILDEFKPTVIVIEDIAKFMKGKSGAKTIIPLAVINRTIGLTIYERTGKTPYFVNVNTVRSLIKITNERISKEQVPAAIEHHLKIKFPFKLDKNGKIKTESYDMADAVAVALAFTKPKFKAVEP